MTTESKTKVWIGTSGYSFHCWHGVFYPPSLPLSRMLEYYAGQFETLELNYSFYRQPTARASAAMAMRTPPGFRFFVKANQSFTHEYSLENWRVFQDGIAPLQTAGKLEGLLFQFPQSFKNRRLNRAWIDRIVETFGEYRLAIEFRDKSWVQDYVFRYFRENDLSMVAVDEPAISTLFPRMPIATNDTGYVRLHSSNAEKWYTGDERYDYFYSDAELNEWAELLSKIGERSRNIFVFFNNCHRGQAAQNAKAMKRIIEQAGLNLSCATVDRDVSSIPNGLWSP